MSKLVALLAAVVLAVPAYAHADVAEPTQDPMPEPAADPAQPSATAASADDETPALSGGRIVGEAALGTAFAIGGGFGGAAIGSGIQESNADCNKQLFCGVTGALLGGSIGLTLATPMGVYLAGNAGDQTGSLGATIGGSAIGAAVSLAVATSIDDFDKAAPVLVAGPLIGSIIGFNMTREYKPSHKHHGGVIVPIASTSSERTTFGLAGSF